METNDEMMQAVVKRCPACGSELSHQYVEDFECDCWVCPDVNCGYIEPVG